MQITTTVNGSVHEADVEPRTLLVDLLRDRFALTGTHIGCEDGKCGACTITVDGQVMKSCMLLAVQADGAEITTVEGLGGASSLNPLQAAFHEHHALQCGYCTPGFLMAARALLERNPNPTEAEVRWGLAGNICRCTGYTNIVKAVLSVAERGGDGEVRVPEPAREEPVPIGDAVEVAIDEPGPESADLDRMQEEEQTTGTRSGGQGR